MIAKQTSKQSVISISFNGFFSNSTQKKNNYLSFAKKHLWSGKFLKTVSILFCIGVLLTGTLWATKEPIVSNKMLSVTDIHFNPFYDPTLAQQLVQQPYQEWDKVFSTSKVTTPTPYKKETNPVLYQMLLGSMKKNGRGIKAIMFSGDILAHDFNEMITQYTGATSNYERNNFIYKTMGYVSMKLRKMFPHVPVYFSLGNNDAYNGDYALVDDGEFLHTTADLFFKNFIKQQKNRDVFYSTYPVHGYYSLPFPAIKQGRIIGLNTIFFSTNYASSVRNDPGTMELNWLEQELIKAKQAGEKVWLLLHIPPGVNVYSTQRNSTPKTINVMLQWQAVYNQRYLEIVRQYSDEIVASFAGHTHMDDFRLIYDTDEADRKAIDFIHISASVTPVFGNNPAFQIINYNPQSGELNDTVTYYIDLKETVPAFQQEYGYSASYNVTPDLSGLAEIYPTLVSDLVKRESYTQYYPVSSTASSIADVWQWYWCGIGNLTPDDFIKAYKQIQLPSQKMEDKR